MSDKIKYKPGLTGLNSEFSVSLTGHHTKAKELSLTEYLPITREAIVGFMPFPSFFAGSEMKKRKPRPGFFLYQMEPEVRRLVRRLERLHLKILKKKQFVVFNQTCLDNELPPKYTIYIYIYIYIYKVIHRQTCFVLSELINVARQ